MRHLKLFEEYSFHGKWSRKPAKWSDVDPEDTYVDYKDVQDLPHYEDWELWPIDQGEESAPMDYFENKPKEEMFVVLVGGFEDGQEFLVDAGGYNYARHVKMVVGGSPNKTNEAFALNPRASLEDNLKTAISSYVYFMEKGTMVLKDGTKRERPMKTSMWLTELNSMEMGDEILFREYPADYTVKKEALETEPQKELKMRYLEFKKNQQEAAMKRSREDWGFGDEGEVGTNPKLKKYADNIAAIEKLMKTVK